MNKLAVLSVLAIAGSALATGSTPVAGGGLIISEAVDGPASGGNPKFVELTNTGLTPFTFGVGAGIIVQSNAATDYDVDVDLEGVTIAPGQSYVIQSAANDGQAAFEATYGFAADLYTGAFFSNGDDRYAIWDGAALVDIHGQDGVDGTGSVWEYLDSYTLRNKDQIAPNGGIYDLTSFTTPGTNFFDGTDAAFVVANTSPGTHQWTPAPGAAALFGMAGLAGIRRRRA